MDQPVYTALCSYGMSGKVFHAPFLKVHEGFQLYAVYEHNTKRVQDEFPEVLSYDTMEEMLADEKIELVVVNTPNTTHYEYAKQALLAGKHVLVEKPFVVHAWQATELVSIAAEKNKLISVYQNRRFDSDFTTVKEVVDKGLLGEVVEAEFHFDRYKQELSPKMHKEMPVQGAGIVYDLGSHIIDQALYLFGRPDAVFADILCQRPISKVDDYFELLLYYGSKRVRLKGGYQVREPLPSFVVHGSMGSFIKSRADVQETDLQAGKIPGSKGWGREPEAEKGLLHTEQDGQVIKEKVETIPGDYMLYFEQLYQALRHGGKVPVTAAEGRAVIEIIEAALESSQQGRVVKIG